MSLKVRAAAASRKGITELFDSFTHLATLIVLTVISLLTLICINSFAATLPVHDRPVVGIKASSIGMRFADLVHEFVLVDGDAEAGLCG